MISAFVRRFRIVGFLLVPLGVAPLGCRRDVTTAAPVEKGVSSVESDNKPAQELFTDVTAAVGFTHQHHKPVLDRQLDNIMSWVCSVGASVAAGDYNNDGWIDVYVTDSHKGTANFLYRNNGNGTFTDVAVEAGVADVNNDHGTSMDAIWGDYDNDGWIDLYVVRWGEDILFRSNGDGTFTDVTATLFKKRDGSPGMQWANGNAAIFWDYNLDGRLDIYVGNYFEEIDLWNLKSTRIMHDSFENARNAGPNFLYRQEKDGTFTEVAKSIGLDDTGWTLAVGSADVNNDGWPDLYCADDFGPDQLFLNKKDGAFENVSGRAIPSDTKKGMNVDFGDFNNDGWLDIYVTNITTTEYLQEGNMLWHNNGPDAEGRVTLTDISLETGTYDGGWGWGAKFFDHDHDGDLDLLSVNGFISAGEGNYWYDLASWTVLGQDSAEAKNWPTIGERSFSGYEADRFFRNDGLFTFTERAKEVGLDSNRDGRGVAVFDYDNDGDLDVYVANQGQPPNFYRNNLSQSNHWLMVKLDADPKTGVNRDAICARVTVLTSQGLQMRERDGGNGFSGQSDPRLHFGLGADERVKLLEVRWPDGGLQYLEGVPADRLLTIRQDPAQYASQMALNVGPPKPWVRKDDAGPSAMPKIAPAELDRLLADLEKQLRERPVTRSLASLYRARCADHDAHDRAISFFQQIVDETPSDPMMRVELACAYVDKIPTCGGVWAVVSKGTLARKSLDQLDRVIKDHPDLWVAYYCRAMNHLHWPRALLHSNDAVADFRRCISLQTRDSAGRREFHLRAYVGLGDALTKAKRYAEARDAWREGLKLFPDSVELTERLKWNRDDELLTFVETERSLEQPIDTSLAFLDKEPG